MNPSIFILLNYSILYNYFPLSEPDWSLQNQLRSLMLPQGGVMKSNKKSATFFGFLHFFLILDRNRHNHVKQINLIQKIKKTLLSEAYPPELDCITYATPLIGCIQPYTGEDFQNIAMGKSRKI